MPEGVKRLRPRMMPVAYASVLSLRIVADVWSVSIAANPEELARWSAAEVESPEGKEP